MTSYPRTTCPRCGRSVAGKVVQGKLVLRPHKKALMGTKASGWGPAQDCPGSRATVDAPLCYRCDDPITGTPVTDPDDPAHREFCSDDCLTTASEQAGGAFADIVLDAEFD